MLVRVNFFCAAALTVIAAAILRHLHAVITTGIPYRTRSPPRTGATTLAA